MTTDPIRTLSLNEVDGAFSESFGLPQPDWDAVYKIADSIEDEGRVADWDSIWTDVAQQWLERLLPHLPSGTRLLKYDNLFALSSAENAESNVEFLHSAMQWLEDAFGKNENIAGPQVIIDFQSAELYYDYVAHHCPEGEQITSVGMCILRGYMHVVMNSPDWSWRPVAIHEFTHLSTAHLDLPVWLNEGLAMWTERELTGFEHTLFDRELRSRMRSLFNEQNINGFWSGEFFSIPDERSELSYALAEILTRRLVFDYRKKIPLFLKAARYEDAGNAGAKEVFGKSLTEFIADMLGSGEWDIRPDDWRLG